MATSLEPSDEQAACATSGGTSSGCGCKHHAAAAVAAAAPSASAKRGCGCGHHAADEPPAAADAADAPAATGEGGGTCKCQRLLWIRKTHAALGLVFAVFVAEHLFATSLGLGPGRFGSYLGFVHATLAKLPGLETVLVFVPFVGLVPFGLFLLVKAGLSYNVKRCNRGGKLRYFLQRASAVAILGFVIAHLLVVRFSGVTAATTAAAAPPALYALSVTQLWGGADPAALSGPAQVTGLALLLLGTCAMIYHLSNGLWSAAIAWGFTATPAAQRRWGFVCVALALTLLMFGVLGWCAFGVLPVAGR